MCDVGSACNHVLAVVENHEDPPATEILGETVHRLRATPVSELQNTDDRCQDSCGIGDVCELDEPPLTLAATEPLQPRLERGARLAGSTGADQRHQPLRL